MGRVWSDDRPLCETCPHFRRYRTSGERSSDRGECWRYPPLAAGPDGDRWAEWPPVDEDDGCGEHPDFDAWWAARKAEGKEPAQP